MQTCSQYWDDNVLCMNVAVKNGKCESSHRRADYRLPLPGTTTGRSLLACPQGSTTPNAQFAARAADTTGASPYKQRIEAIQSWGPQTAGAEMVHGISCLHDTQKANNVTVWYSWSDDQLTVWGLGSHTGGSGAGNRKYEMLWYDGTNKKWTRG